MIDNDFDLKLSQAVRDKLKKVKDKKKGESSPLSHKKKRAFSKIRSAIRSKTDLDYK